MRQDAVRGTERRTRGDNPSIAPLARESEIPASWLIRQCLGIRLIVHLAHATLTATAAFVRLWSIFADADSDTKTFPRRVVVFFDQGVWRVARRDIANSSTSLLALRSF